MLAIVEVYCAEIHALLYSTSSIIGMTAKRGVGQTEKTKIDYINVRSDFRTSRQKREPRSR